MYIVTEFLKSKVVDKAFYLRIILFGTVLGLGILWGTEHNGFKWSYHNDESSKLRQIQSGDYNMRHPPLMLEVVRLLVPSDQREDPQVLVERGRFLSACYVALAFAFLSDLLFMQAGLLIAALGAMLMLFNPLLYEIAHYFKEDSLLLLGCAFSIWVLVLLEERPTRFTAALTGFSLALLCSGKYVGCLYAVLPLSHLLWLRLEGKKSLHWGWLGFSVLFWSGLFYLPTMWFWQNLRESGSDEWVRLLHGEYGAGLPVPHHYYIDKLIHAFGDQTLFFGIFCYFIAAGYSKLRATWIMPGLAFATLLVLSWTSKVSDRYLLPATLMIACMLVTGPWFLSRKWLDETGFKKIPLLPALASLMVAVSVLSHQQPVWAQLRLAFACDSRSELEGWLRSCDLSTMILAEDSMVQMHEVLENVPVRHAYFVSDLGSLDELRQQGVTHVLVSYDMYHRYVDGSRDLSGGENDQFARRSDFYKRLLSEGQVVWSRPGCNPKSLHPGLKVVKILGD